MQILGPAQQPLTEEQIIAQYGSALDECLKSATDPQYEFERQIQLNKARQQWQMVLGNHFLIPGMVQSSYGDIADFVPFDGSTLNEESGADVKFCRPINLIGGDCYKFIAVMGNSAPRVKAVADDPSNSDQIRMARNADACVRDLWEKWKADQKQRVLAFHQYTTGPAYIRTSWVTNGRKYGQTVEPTVGVQSAPDGSSIPVEGQPQVYENGDVECHIYTVLEVSHPYMAKTLDDCAWFVCEVMRQKWDLLAAFAGKDGQPGPLEQYREGDLPDDDQHPSSVTAAEARESVANPSRIGRVKRQNWWRFREVWIQPWLYEAITDPTARQTIQRQFPDGLYLAKVGSVTVRAENRKLTDEWAVCKTGRGEKILEDPIAADSVPIQRTINDLVGMAQETILRAITQTIIDSQLVDRESWAKKEAIPAEILLTAMPVDGDLSKRIYQIPPTRLSDQLGPLLDRLRAAQQDITGIRPELTGGGQPTQTFREAKQRKDQALMQLSPQAQEMQYAWEYAGANGVRLRAKYGSGTIKSARKGAYGPETDIVDMAELSNDGWHCEADDNWPMTAADRFDKFYGLLKEFPPEVTQSLSLMDPLNADERAELLEVDGFTSVVVAQKEKTMTDIAQLVQGQPIPGQPGPNGQPGPQQPSVQPDPYDNFQVVVPLLQAWMLSDKGQAAKNQNPAGFSNVMAYWQAAQQMSQPPQPPPPPPVRPALNVSAKLEDMPPEFTQEILQGAGLPGNPQAQPAPPPAPAPPDGLGAPTPAEGQESPLPPMPPTPPGPQAPALQ